MESPTSASSTYACLEGCIILNEYRRELSVENNQDTLFPRGIVAIVPTRSIYARKNAGRKLGWIAEREKETARCFSLLVVHAKILSVLPQAAPSNHHVFSQDDFMLSLHVLHSVQLHTAIKASLCMSAILALLSTLFYPNLSSLNRYNEQAKRRSGLLKS